MVQNIKLATALATLHTDNAVSFHCAECNEIGGLLT